ncbi:MAG: helix-turn-helix domain-containing protein [Nocardioides sp.]|nr:helix-turn-helix domain-containing protein [Nocardioides sp.]
MKQSAIPRSRAINPETSARIVEAAQALALAHGMDGFTMERLAGDAGVSRRTLFNYFPTKADAILGGSAVLAEEQRAQFVAGGPTGDLVADLGHIVTEVLATRGTSREQLTRVRTLLRTEPRLLLAAQEGIHRPVEELTDAIAERDGSASAALHAHLLVRLLVGVLDVAVDRFLDNDSLGEGSDDLDALFLDTLAHTRALVAPR